MKTHYEKSSKYKRQAQNLLKQYDFRTALQKSAGGNTEIIVDLVREHIASVCELEFEDVLTTQQGLDIIALTSKAAQLTGLKRGVEGELLMQTMIAWQVARYEKHGKRTYVVSPGLSRILLATEFKGIRCGDLKLPYPSVYIAVDPNLGFKVFHQRMGETRLYGVYISQDMFGWRILFCGLPDEGFDHSLDDALVQFHVSLVDEEKLVVDVLDELAKNSLSKSGQWRYERGFSDEVENMVEAIEEWNRAFIWVMNLMFYVTRPDFTDLEHIDANKEVEALYRRMRSLPKDSKKRKKLSERLREQERRPRIVVGRRVVIDERLPRNVRESISKVFKRTLVPAHWQRYHVGKGRLEVAWRFKEPFWRGEGPEENKPHEVR